MRLNGAELRAARVRAGYPTIESFAEALGAAARAVGAWERDEATPQARYQRKIEDVLGVHANPPTTTPSNDIAQLPDHQLWALRRQADAEIERRYYEARTAADTARAQEGNTRPQPGLPAPFPDHLATPQVDELRESGETP